MDLKTQIKGELLKSIERGLITSFKNIYPQYNVTVDYKCDRKDYNTRYFNVYIEGETININDKIPLVSTKSIFVDRFNNDQAINFSEHGKENFEKVSEYKPENLDIIRNAITALEIKLKDKGVFRRKDVNFHGYSIQFEMIGLPNIHQHSMDRLVYIYKNFRGNISIKNAEKCARDIGNEIEYEIEKMEKKARA